MALPSPAIPTPGRRDPVLLAVLGIGLIVLILASLFFVYYGNQFFNLPSLISRSSTERNSPANQECWYLSSEKNALYLSATLGNGPYNTTVVILVDTGAIISVAPAELASRLGISLYSGSPVTLQGIFGDTQQLYLHNVSLTLGRLHTVIVPIAIATGNTVPYTLGREGFLDQFSLQVNQNLRNFCITQP